MSTEPVFAQTDQNLGEVSLDLIDPNPYQPRLTFDEAELNALADSIRAHGLIQPIVIQVHPPSGRYILHDGERRLRAARLAGLEKIPAVIQLQPATDKDLLIRAVVANDQRADLNPVERARSYQRLADEQGMSDNQIAQAVGKSRSAVANARRLLQLPADRQTDLAAGKLSERQALALLPLYQLPPEVQEKVQAAGASWQKNPLDKPHQHSSDELRAAIKGNMRRAGVHISLISPEEPFAGDGLRSPRCLDCDLYQSMDNEPYCLDRACYQAKTIIWQRQILEPAKAATGIDYLDPANEPKLNKYTNLRWYTGVLKHARSQQCPHLRLQYEQYTNLSSDDLPKRVTLVCLHPGKNAASCKCKQAVEAGEKAREKALRQETDRIRDRAIAHITKDLADLPLPILKLLCHENLPYKDQEKVVTSDDPADLARRYAAKIIGAQIWQPDRPDQNRRRLDELFTKVGILTGHQATIARIDSDLARLENFQHHNDLSPEDVAVTLTNLSQIAEELHPLAQANEDLHHDIHQERDLFARLDRLKAHLLANRTHTEIQHQLDALTAWLAETPNPTYTDLSGKKKELAGIFQQIDALALSPIPADLMTAWEPLHDQIEERLKNYQYKPLVLEIRRI